MLKLYHYSDYDFKGYIKPGYFGANSYSRASERVSGIKRSYFYVSKTGREWIFNGARFLYIAEISRGRLYDLNKDILRVKDNKKIKDIYTYIKRLGYSGIIGSNGRAVAVLFTRIKIKNKLGLAGGIR